MLNKLRIKMLDNIKKNQRELKNTITETNKNYMSKHE